MSYCWKSLKIKLIQIPIYWLNNTSLKFISSALILSISVVSYLLIVLNLKCNNKTNVINWYFSRDLINAATKRAVCCRKSTWTVVSMSTDLTITEKNMTKNNNRTLLQHGAVKWLINSHERPTFQPESNAVINGHAGFFKSDVYMGQNV